MRTDKLSGGLKFSLGLASIILAGAAGPVDTSITPAFPQASIEAAGIVAHTVTATSASFQQAPIPDPDVNAPADTRKPDTTLSPTLLSPKSLFQGDGYAFASSEQSSLDDRRPGVPGLGLTVPVK